MKNSDDAQRACDGADGLVHLDRDHPGFRDPAYRRRRDEIARLAEDWRPDKPTPEVRYDDAEHGVWRAVWDQLLPLHRRYACRAYREASARLALPASRVPQFHEVNARLLAAGGYTLAPVAGLVTPRRFLSWLGRGVFLATQYMRHPSTPLYTPEPDVVHELIGHAASLLDPDLVALSRLFGAAIDGADEAREARLIRVYWWTVEFGLVEEEGALKAYGAGLLSSSGELERLASGAELLPLDLDRAAQTAFDPTGYQAQLFVAKGWRSLVDELSGWLRAECG